MKVGSAAALAGWLATLAAISCTLPAYQRLEPRESELDQSADPAGAPGCPALDLALGSACNSCIAEHCCGEAGACSGGKCGAEIDWPINPLTEVTPEFDALAACMLEHCDGADSCDTSWGCVGKYKWPVLREAHPFAIHVIDYASANEVGIRGIEVKLCESSDPGCREGSGYLSTAETDASGNADFTAPKGFSGYFQLEGAMTAPATVQWSQPVYNLVERFTHQALSTAALTGFAQLVGFHSRADQPFEPNTGHLIARIQNCLPLRYMETIDPIARSRDVVFGFTPSSGATRMYYINEQAQLETELDRTSARGYAGALQVLATNVTVTARQADTGKLLADGTLTIRAGTIGYVYLVPNTGQ